MLRLTLHDLAVFTVAGGIFCYLVIRYLTKPLNQLGEAAANIAEGRLDTRVDPALKNRRDEIAGLARNFDRMAERIEALITGQRRLLGDVSHELRSPLSRLIVALSLVKARSSRTKEAAENLERIGLEARRLDALIGQLLALTRIDSGVDRGAPAQFDLTNLVQEVASDGDFEARARNRRVVDRTRRCLRPSTGSKSCCEAPSRTWREMRSGTPPREPPSRFRLQIAQFPRVCFASGTTARECRRLCCPTSSCPSGAIANGDSDGAGLGLAIAERAVHVHRGTIRAMNAPAGGLIVEIDLPVA